MRLDPYGFSRLFHLLLRFLIISILFSSFSHAQNDVAEEIESTDEPIEYRTGKLNQFKGFYTPRPFMPSSMDLSYASIWATWSAWSFCSNGVQVRVRACNTVRGFSCLGPNQEKRPCGEPKPPKFNPALAEQDYDAIDPWVEDRREAMRQLYSDYEAPKLAPPPKAGLRRKPARRPVPIGAPDSDFSVQSPDGRRNFRVVQQGAPTQTFCGYGSCGGGLAPPPRGPSSVANGGPAQAPSMTPEKLYSGSKNPYEENPNGKKKAKKHRARGEKTQKIGQEVLEQHLEEANKQTEETTTTEQPTTTTEEILEAVIPVGRQKPTEIKPSSKGSQEEIEYFNTDDSKIDYDEDYGKGPTTTQPEFEEDTVQPTEETSFSYPPTVRLKLVTAPPKGSKVRALMKHRGEEIDFFSNKGEQESTQDPIPPSKSVFKSSDETHPEVVQPKITYTANFSAIPDSEEGLKKPANRIVSAVPLPPMFSIDQIEGPAIELTGEKSIEDKSNLNHEVGIGPGRNEENEVEQEEHEVDHHAAHDAESLKERAKIPDSEKMGIEGPFTEQEMKQAVHEGDVHFGKDTITDDTAKALEWLLANMTKAAELREHQLQDTHLQSQNSLDQQSSQQIDSIHQESQIFSGSKSREALHSGEVIIPKLFKSKIGEYHPSSFPRIHGIKTFKSTDKNLKYDSAELKKIGAKIFTHLTTNVIDKNVVIPKPKIEGPFVETPEDSSRTTEAPRIPSIDEQKYGTFTSKITRKELPELSKISASVEAKDGDDTENIEAEISRLRTEMKQMESQLKSLKNQEDDMGNFEKSEDETIEHITHSPIINPKAYNLNLVPTGPRSSSGGLPPVLQKENRGEITFQDDTNLKESQWNDWSDWNECFCDRQVRTRTCNYESGYHSKGCVGKSYETRECVATRPCPSLNIHRLHKTSTLPPPSTFYTLAPPGKRRLGANFIFNPLAISKLSKRLKSTPSRDQGSFHAMTVRKLYHI